MGEIWKGGPTWHFPDQMYVAVGDGYAVPNGFTVTAESGDMTVELDVIVADGRARTRKVSVVTDSPRGVTSTTLRSVPIRDLVATFGIRKTLARVEAVDEQNATITPVTEWGPNEIQIMKRLVGYVDVEPPGQPGGGQ